MASAHRYAAADPSAQRSMSALKRLPRDILQKCFKFLEFNFAVMLVQLRNSYLRSSRSWLAASTHRQYSAAQPARRNDDDDVEFDDPDAPSTQLGYPPDEKGFNKWLRGEGYQYRDINRPRNWLGGGDAVELAAVLFCVNLLLTFTVAIPSEPILQATSTCC
jgi:hypothetical protein